MQQIIRRACVAAMLAAGIHKQRQGKKAWTWDEVRARFEANNPTLLADNVSYRRIQGAADHRVSLARTLS